MPVTQQPRHMLTQPGPGLATEILKFPPPLPIGLPDIVAAPLPRIPGYEFMRLIDHGGMSNIYLARQENLQRNVAIKMIRPQDRLDENVRKRFRMEAASISSLQHPNVVQIIEVGETEGMPYLCLEYVAGGNLERRIQEHQPSPRTAAGIVRQLAEAMQAAHDQQIIHRDLKPANILCVEAAAADDATPQVKITDFGLARIIYEHSDQTKSGYAIGTPSFMSPEQASGHPEQVGKSTDIYGLGAILYELLTKNPPFLGPTALETIQMVRFDAPIRPSLYNPDVPRDLERICLHCLEKRPEDRYGTARELAADLGRFLQNRTVIADQTGTIQRWLRRCLRHPSRTIAAISLPALIVSSSIIFGLLNRTQPDPKPTEFAQTAVSKAPEIQPDPPADRVTSLRLQPTRHNPLLAKQQDAVALKSVARDYPRDFAVQYTVAEALLHSEGTALALPYMEVARRLAEEQTRSGEGGLESWANLSFAHERLGDLHLKQTDHKAARREYERALQIREMLAQDDPRDPRWQLDLAVICGKQADVIAAVAERFTAVLLLDRRIGLLNGLLADMPTLDKEIRLTHRRLAELHQELGNPKAAELHRHEAEVK